MRRIAHIVLVWLAAVSYLTQSLLGNPTGVFCIAAEHIGIEPPGDMCCDHLDIGLNGSSIVSACGPAEECGCVDVICRGDVGRPLRTFDIDVKWQPCMPAPLTYVVTGPMVERHSSTISGLARQQIPPWLAHLRTVVIVI